MLRCSTYLRFTVMRKSVTKKSQCKQGKHRSEGDKVREHNSLVYFIYLF